MHADRVHGMLTIICVRCSDLVPEQTDEGQAAETADVVDGSGAITCLVLGTTCAPVFLRRADDVTVAAPLLRQLGTAPGRHCFRDVI